MDKVGVCRGPEFPQAKSLSTHSMTKVPLHGLEQTSDSGSRGKAPRQPVNDQKGQPELHIDATSADHHGVY